MPRTLELLSKLGLTEEALKRGLSMLASNPLINGNRVTRIEFQKQLPDLPYPHPLMLPQHETEALLTEALLRQGGAIEWATELTRFSQHDGHVEAMLRHSNAQEEQVEADWVIGCDGAHSTVRVCWSLNLKTAPWSRVLP